MKLGIIKFEAVFQTLYVDMRTIQVWLISKGIKLNVSTYELGRVIGR